MKKLLLGLGSIAAIAAPVAAVVACGSKDDSASGTVVPMTDELKANFAKAIYGDTTTTKITDVKVTATEDKDGNLTDIKVSFTAPAKATETDAKLTISAAKHTMEVQAYKVDGKPVTHALLDGKDMGDVNKADGKGEFVMNAVNVFGHAATKAVDAAKAAAAVKAAPGGAAALAGLKTLNTKAIDASGLSDADKTSVKAKIKAATDTAALTTIMADAAKMTGFATVSQPTTGTGTVTTPQTPPSGNKGTGTGTGAGTGTVTANGAGTKTPQTPGKGTGTGTQTQAQKAAAAFTAAKAKDVAALKTDAKIKLLNVPAAVLTKAETKINGAKDTAALQSLFTSLQNAKDAAAFGKLVA